LLLPDMAWIGLQAAEFWVSNPSSVVCCPDQMSKTVWIAVGDYMGQRIETKGSSRGAAIKRWTEAARYRGTDNPLFTFPAPARLLSPKHLPQRQGIPNGIPAAVIVEVHEHVPPHVLPLPDAIRPPAQIVITV
jgi:hypothetical protein